MTGSLMRLCAAIVLCSGVAHAQTINTDVVTFTNPDGTPADGTVVGTGVLKQTATGARLAGWNGSPRRRHISRSVPGWNTPRLSSISMSNEKDSPGVTTSGSGSICRICTG